MDFAVRDFVLYVQISLQTQWRVQCLAFVACACARRAVTLGHRVATEICGLSISNAYQNIYCGEHVGKCCRAFTRFTLAGREHPDPEAGACTGQQHENRGEDQPAEQQLTCH